MISLTRERYNWGAVVLHWAIAALLIANLVLGWRMGFLKGLAQFNVFQLHKSIGITILVLSVLRLAWRLIRPPPPESEALAPWERTAATIVHWAFYVVMIGMPLSGWAMASASPLHIPTLLYRLIPWPAFPGVAALSPGARTQLDHGADLTHVVLAWSALALLALHLGAVAKHMIEGRSVLGRMAPWWRSRALAQET